MDPNAKRILFLAPPGAGQLNPCLALAKQLRARGHRVEWAIPDAARGKVEAEGFPVTVVGPKELDFQNREVYAPGHDRLQGWDEFLFTAKKLVIGPSGEIAR